MKIESYRLTNYGPYRDVTYEPGDARLCIIVGENGTGKTTLVSEALGHALFKDDRGSVNGGVRNGQTDSAVTVEWTMPDGSRMRAIRRRSLRGAGKSSADLQVRNGTGWTPVAEGDKEVPAAVRELLHMDAATFRTSVSLAQNDLRRFVDATSSKRKEVLAEIVVDPRFAPAAELASKRARELQAKTAADRDQAARLEARLAERPAVEERLAGHRADLEATAAHLAVQVEARGHLEQRLRSIDVELAAADAIAGQVASLEAERVAAVDAWRRASARITASELAMAHAQTALADEVYVAEAADSLPAMQAGLETLLGAERADRVLAHDIDVKRRELEASNREYSDTLSTHRARYEAARRHVDALAAAAAGTPVACEVCGYEHNAGADPAHLAAARVAFRELEGAEPKPPVGFAREQAALARLEARRRETGFDAERMVKLQADVRQVAATAARSEGMTAARATLERERAAIAEAEAEKAGLTARGTSIAGRIAELVAKAAEADPLRAERSRLAAEETQTRSAITELERSRTIGVQLVAREEAALEQLDAVAAERDALAASLEAVSLEAGRLRYLAGRFGLKGIPARVIEGVLPELTAYANEVLGELFGLRLELRATRASADGRSTIEALELVVTKDDVGEVELARASGGQGTAIALALALGLSRLNARRAGTAIRSLVIDEPEGLDVIRLKALGAYLRGLLHRGELDRAFVVSHTSELVEFGDRVDEVMAGPDGPELRQIA